MPWSALVKSPNKFLDKCYLPDGVFLTEISKMRGGALTACIHHWSGRISKGDIAFRFKAVDDAHQREVDVKKKKRRAAPDEEPETPKEEPAESSHHKTFADTHDSEEESADKNEVTGKGKAKAAVDSWCEGFSYGS